MKKIILSATLLSAIMMLGVQLSINAATVIQDTPERGYISTTAQVEAELTPDVAEIRISVVTSDSKSLQKATLENKEISDNVHTAIKALIDSSKGDYVKTSNFRATPIYTYSSNGKKNLNRYEVSNEIIVHTKCIAKVGSIIDKSIGLGATDVTNLTFSVSDYENKCNELIGKASVKAKTRGDIASKASGSYITGIKSMNISCSMNQANTATYNRYLAKNMVMSAGAMTDEAAAEMPSTPIQTGIVKLFANVNATYFVK